MSTAESNLHSEVLGMGRGHSVHYVRNEDTKESSKIPHSRGNSEPRKYQGKENNHIEDKGVVNK